MERRQIAGALAAASSTGGIALIVAGLNPANVDFSMPLLLAGTGCLASGGTTWATLWLTAANKVKSDPRYLSVPDAADWLYLRGSEALRDWLRRGAPDHFATIRDHGVAFIHAAAEAGSIALYGRRGPDLPLEALSADEIEMDNMVALFQPETEAFGATYVRRTDLKKALRHAEASISARRGTLAAAS